MPYIVILFFTFSFLFALYILTVFMAAFTDQSMEEGIKEGKEVAKWILYGAVVLTIVTFMVEGLS